MDHEGIQVAVKQGRSRWHISRSSAPKRQCGHARFLSSQHALMKSRMADRRGTFNLPSAHTRSVSCCLFQRLLDYECTQATSQAGSTADLASMVVVATRRVLLLKPAASPGRSQPHPLLQRPPSSPHQLSGECSNRKRQPSASRPEIEGGFQDEASPQVGDLHLDLRKGGRPCEA